MNWRPIKGKNGSFRKISRASGSLTNMNEAYLELSGILSLITKNNTVFSNKSNNGGTLEEMIRRGIRTSQIPCEQLPWRILLGKDDHRVKKR